MASSMWSALEQAQAVGGTGVGGGVGSGVSSVAGSVGGIVSSDPAWLHSLSSALNVAGDAEFWEESISPNTVRNSLSTADPSNPSHTSTILRGMKWLLANMSKGRDVSDFYPHVVKLVQATSLEARKLVYLYLVQYADSSPATRELSLLSINSFQRGLGDPEQWIRGLALRVLTSIRLADILQIQILAAQRCANDSSPYVRKCAATALVKLHRASVDDPQRSMVVELLVELLEREESTMVLTSALIAFAELQVDLKYLHSSFRKICHLLTDMDEWGQVVVLELMARYCRTYFKKPPEGAAEKIDRERRVVVVNNNNNSAAVAADTKASATIGNSPSATTSVSSSGEPSATTASMLPPRQPAVNKVKRRVIRKGFYSDEEDSSTDEEVYENPLGQLVPSISQALREQPVDGASAPGSTNSSSVGVAGGGARATIIESEMESLAPDHRLLLTSALPLLKSRNAGVVLAVCALSYYCGVASIPARVAIGKALVRISRDKREIQFVVLTSIRTLAMECPSAFTPYLSDFFITAMDPEFTKLIKLDILTLLALEPTAIDKVLGELRAYVISSASAEPSFAAAAIRSVGRVAEMARRVRDRHGHKHHKVEAERRGANVTALNCLFGLVTLSQVASDKPVVVGECVRVMQHILQMLNSDSVPVEDPNFVRAKALKRVLLLVVGSLTSRAFVPQPQDGDDEEDDGTDAVDDLKSRLQKATTKDLPAEAVASGMWILGEFLALPTFDPSPTTVLGGDNIRVTAIRTELIRLVARAFPDLDTAEKEQGIHMASKFLLSMAGTGSEAPLCENVLAMGRLDLNPDLRDRARFESGLIHVSLGLRHDTDGLDSLPPTLTRKLSVDQAKQILLRRKLASSSLPTTKSGSKSESFRFGTLSSLVGHRARSAYVPLPPWADKDTPSNLRDPPEKKVDPVTSRSSAKAGPTSKGGQFYGSSSSSSEDSSSDDESSSSASSSDDSSDSESSSSSQDDSTSSSSANLLQMPQPKAAVVPQPVVPVAAVSSSSSAPRRTIMPKTVVNDESDDSSGSSSSDDDDEDGDSSDSSPLLASLTSPSTTANPSLLSLGGTATSGPLLGLGSVSSRQAPVPSSSSNVSDDLKGLVLSPVAVSASDSRDNADVDRDSSAWMQMVRPDLAGGLSVQARYVRGATRRREALSMGWAVLDSAPAPNVVCLQFRFENQKKDSMSFRRLRLQQRSSVTTSTSSSSIIGPRKVVTPPEIPQLSPGQKVDCYVGIEFAGITDRDGSLQAKFDVQYGTGSVPIEIKPNVGDLLQPPPPQHAGMSAETFDAAVRQLHGFQRIESRFDGRRAADGLSRRVVENVAVVPVGTTKQTSNVEGQVTLRFIGYLPSAGDPVYIQLTHSSGASGKIVVCCLQPLAVNSIMNQVKRALS